MFDPNLPELEVREIRTETANIFFIAIGRGLPPAWFLIFIPNFGSALERKRCKMRITASHIPSFSDPSDRTQSRRCCGRCNANDLPYRRGAVSAGRSISPL